MDLRGELLVGVLPLGSSPLVALLQHLQGSLQLPVVPLQAEELRLRSSVRVRVWKEIKRQLISLDLLFLSVYMYMYRHMDHHKRNAVHMWQFWIENKHYSIAYFNHVTEFKVLYL